MIALVVAALVTGIGPGRAEAAVVTGRIANTAGGCLENANNATTANNPQQLDSCGTNAGQQWSRYADGTLRVQGRCADLLGGATAANTRVVLAPCSPTSSSQRWTLYAAGNVANQKSRTCLAPLNNQIRAELAVVVATCATVNAQKWALPAASTTTTPTTTAAPTTTPKATQTTQTWSSDFTGSGFGMFDDTPWNNVGASAPEIVSSPVTAGAKAARFTMPAGGTRTEIVPTTAEFTEGQDRWFRFSFVLPANFPTRVTTWQVITQWKNDGEGSPPLEITVGRGDLNLEGGYGYPGTPRTFAQPLAPATTGTRTDLVVHVFFSRDPSKGTVDVWKNGAQVLSGYKPAGGTLYPTSAAATATTDSYWKMGIYRDSTITQQAQYTIESAAIGNTRAQVS